MLQIWGKSSNFAIQYRLRESKYVCFWRLLLQYNVSKGRQKYCCGRP